MIQTGRPAVPAAIRFLPAVPEGFELSDSERLSDGLRRLSLEEFDRAIGGLLHGSDVDVAVHEARKSMKRLRAVLRMIRDELGEERYRRENELLRNTARLIGPVRDSAVLMKTVATTRARFAVHLRRSAFETLESNLARRHEEARARLVEDPDSLGDRGIVNKVGSLALARGAREHGVPVWVAADRSKWLPPGFPQPVEDDRPAEEVWRGARGVTVWNRYFEVLPASLVDRVVTDAGSYTPKELDEERRALRVAPVLEEWARRT